MAHKEGTHITTAASTKNGGLHSLRLASFCGSGWESNTEALFQGLPRTVDEQQPDSRNAGTTYGDSVNGDGWMDAAPVEALIVDADPHGEPPKGKPLPASIVYKLLFPEIPTIFGKPGKGSIIGHPDSKKMGLVSRKPEGGSIIDYPDVPINTLKSGKPIEPSLNPLQYPEIPTTTNSVPRGAA